MRKFFKDALIFILDVGSFYCCLKAGAYIGGKINNGINKLFEKK